MNWYPVYTNPRAEKKVYTALEQKGITAYLPIQKQLRQWSDRKKWVDVPIFPSYLFVHLNPSQMSAVLTCQGVSRFIYFSGKIATIPERQITQLRLLLANATDIEVVDREFEKGQQVIVRAGPLQGLMGELISWHSKQKMLIRIDYLTQSLLIQISPAFIEPLDLTAEWDKT